MIRAKSIHSGYGRLVVLHDISLALSPGECVALLGANGAGKSTLLKTFVGVVPVRFGSIEVDDRPMPRISPERALRAGVALVPQGRGVFVGLTVRQNLMVGGHGVRGRDELARRVDAALERFPVLAERQSQPAGLLSGGEQQMLALSRALVSDPKVLLIDEPSLGLAPQVISFVAQVIRSLREEGRAVVVAEQNIGLAMQVADRVVGLRNGRIVHEGAPGGLTSTALHELYL